MDASEGLVKVDKKISFGGVTKTFSEILLINLPQNENDGAQYKIAEVLSVANYKAENNSCGASLIINEDDIDLYEKKKAADAYFFEQKNYLAAENLYEYILAKDPRNLTVQKQILLCKQNLTRSDYFNRANNFYDRKEFLNAQYWYKKLLTEYPDDPEKQTINNKIEAARLGQIELNYENARTRADVALAADNFNDARYYYEQALLVKPGDRYAALKLEDAKIQDDRFAEQQINRAVMLAEQSSKYYGEYFRVLMKYEGYGNHTRLNDKQYYNMVLLLNSYDSRVMKAMNFTRRDCRLYCKIYCKKLNDRYYSVQDFNLKEDIRNLLDNVINQRNQN
ncbi:MAG TPA: hypothetical protein VHE59_16255 [Mucilaginibacter sp.]|nr:hypothetical protein [Mucilaginibacter sp.]